MIAEDGNPYPHLSHPRQQYTAFLSPGKTMDVLLTPTHAGTGTARHAIYDSRMFDTNNGAQGGGMLALLDVTPPAAAAAAPAFDSTPVTTATVGVPYAYAAHATDPNGDPVTYALTAMPPDNTMTINPATGLINWLPPTAGSYPVTVRASDNTPGTPLFSDQAYTILVAAAPNGPPTARNDSYTAIAHPAASGLLQTVAAPGVLANDTDPDGNALQAGSKTGASQVTLAANGGFTLAPTPTTGTLSFAYRASDPAGAISDPATVTLTVRANSRPTTVSDAFAAPRCTFRVGTGTACQTGAGAYQPVALNLTSNDTDPDTQTIDVANQLPLSVARLRVSSASANGIAATVPGTTLTTANGGRVTVTGTLATGLNVTYTPLYNYAGTDSFQYKVRDRIGLTAGSTNALGWATVTVTVQ